jgi:nitrite reductase/ring-hydroxylating ferredoxin subunit
VRSVVVARADEIPPGTRKIVEIGGRSIGVFNIGGRYYALRNRCPHQGGPLCSGLQFSPLRSDAPGEYELGGEGEIIRCPWHGWEFDITSGHSWFDPERQRVRRYPASVREECGGELASAEVGDAESYPARAQGPYVVVDLDG